MMVFSVRTTKELVNTFNQIKEIKDGDWLEITESITIYKTPGGYAIANGEHICNVGNLNQAFNELIRACLTIKQ